MLPQDVQLYILPTNSLIDLLSATKTKKISPILLARLHKYDCLPLQPTGIDENGVTKVGQLQFILTIIYFLF